MSPSLEAITVVILAFKSSMSELRHQNESWKPQDAGTESGVRSKDNKIVPTLNEF